MVTAIAAEPAAERSDGIEAAAAPELRPFYLIVVFWGERFRNYFVDYCLPALLAPGNIPSLINGRKNKLLICTTPEDWAAIERLPIFRLLEAHMTPVLIEIPPAPPDKSGCQHMGVGHKLATELAHRDKAYGIMLTPDLMLSDGALAAIQRHALGGAQVVLSAAMRFSEEPLFAGLEATGLMRSGERLSALGRPLALPPRDLVRVGLQCVAADTMTYEWQAPFFADFPCASWWRVPGERGIIVHSFSWAPLLLDFSALDRHDTTCLETWTVDGDYVDDNFGRCGRIHVVQDSDELILVSWSPLGERPDSLRPKPLQTWPIIGEWVKGESLRNAYYSDVFDAVKRSAFLLTVRWHADDLTAGWAKTEKRASEVIRKYILRDCVESIHPDPAAETDRDGRSESRANGRWQGTTRGAAVATVRMLSESGFDARLLARPKKLTFWNAIFFLIGVVIRTVRTVAELWTNRARHIRLLGRALAGDRAAAAKIRGGLAWRLDAIVGIYRRAQTGK